jgi:DNA repair protein RecO (recombination protein O)
MPSKVVEGIILQVKPYGEADLIIDFFTSQWGRLRGFAKGAKKSKKRFVNCLDPLNWVRLTFFEKQNYGLVRIDQAELLSPFPGIRKDYKKWGQASYFCEMIKELFAVGDSNPAVFELIRESLLAMDQGKGDQEIFGIFQIRLLKMAGYALYLNSCLGCGKVVESIPDPVFSLSRGGIFCPGCLKVESGQRLSPGSVQGLRQAVQMNLPQVFRLRFSRTMVEEIEQLLHHFSCQIMGKELGSTRYLKQIQEAYR